MVGGAAAAAAPLLTKVQRTASGDRGTGEGAGRRKNVLVVGDSLITGVGCNPEGKEGPTLPRAVAECMARCLRVDVSWTAIGKTGANIATLHSKLLPAVLEEVSKVQAGGGKVDVVVVVCGLNDFKHAYRSRRNTASAFREDLGEFVGAIQEHTGVGCTVVLPALPVASAPVFDGVWPAQPMLQRLAALWDQQKLEISQRVRRVCFVRGDVGEEASQRRYWAADGIHPSDEGYRVWGEHIGQGIVKQLGLHPTLQARDTEPRPADALSVA